MSRQAAQTGKRVRVRLPEYVSTGSKALDELFGGYEPGILTLFYGPTGVGKSTLAVHVPIVKLSKYMIDKYGGIPDGYYFYVVDGDMGTGFDLKRFKKIVEANGLPVDDVLSHVIIFRVNKFDQQHKVVTAEIPGLIEAGKKPLLIALDSAVMIYHQIITTTPQNYLASRIREYTGKLAKQLEELARVSQNEECICTVTSWPKSRLAASEMVKKAEEEASKIGIDEMTPCIGGRGFGYVPKVVVEIRFKEKSRGSLREAYLFKHRSVPADRSAVFKLSDKGVEDV